MTTPRDRRQINLTDFNLYGEYNPSSKVQQKVVPGRLDEIGQTSLTNAWGKKTGDRLVADVLLYNNPTIGMK